MNAWKLIDPRVLKKEECPVPEPEEGKIRVRITKLMLSKVDADIYMGNVKAKLPLIPGRYAIGQISNQTDNPLFPKNLRVLLHAYHKKPDLGTQERDFSEEEVSFRGMTEDGYLRDFINVGADEMTPLPDSVNDVDALLVHYIAIARTVIDKLQVKKGDRVAVVGANFIGILISQLLIYQQVSPILIDSNADRLGFAKRSGVYYALLASDNVINEVASVTGGRLADKSIFVKTSDEDPALAFSLVKHGGSVVVCAPDRTGFTLDFGVAMRKQLSVISVCDPEGSLETAFNLVISRAINLDPLKSAMTAIDKPEDLFENDDYARDAFRVHIFNLF